MFLLILLTIMAAFPVGIAGFTDTLYQIVPKQYHRVPSKIIWLTVTAFVVEIAAGVLAKNAPLFAGVLALVGFVLYLGARMMGFMGLAAAYNAYETELSIGISNKLPSAILASVLDGIVLVGVTISTIMTGSP